MNPHDPTSSDGPLDGISDSNGLEKAESYRQRKATSVLAIVFTDIANSTGLRESLGERPYEEIREAYDDAVNSIIEEDDDGVVVKGTGDGCLAVFAEPSTAVERCIRIQQEFRDHSHFKLRIGIDMGQVSVRSSRGIVRDVFGRHVNRSARIQALAEPGQVLVSFQVFDCAVGWLKDRGVKWRNHGAQMLKGFDDPISIHEPFFVRENGILYSRADRPISSDAADGMDQSAIIDETDQAPLASRGPIDGFDPPLFSRNSASMQSSFRRPTLRRATDSEWDAIYRGLAELSPIDVSTEEFEQADPLPYYLSNIGSVVWELTVGMPIQPAILWVDDFPENNEEERAYLQELNCRVDVATDTESALEMMRGQQYILVISDMSRGNDEVAGLTLLQRRRAAGLFAPTFVYASPSAIGFYGDEAREAGAILCTAGLISLFQGIHSVLSEVRSRLPRDISSPKGRKSQSVRDYWRDFVARIAGGGKE